MRNPLTWFQVIVPTMASPLPTRSESNKNLCAPYQAAQIQNNCP